MESKIKSHYELSEIAEDDLLEIFLTGMESFGITRAKQYYQAMLIIPLKKLIIIFHLSKLITIRSLLILRSISCCCTYIPLIYLIHLLYSLLNPFQKFILII